MLSIVVKQSFVIASLGFSLSWATGAYAAQPESEAKVVARLYKDYAWQAFTAQPELFGDGVAGESRATLEKYFSPELAKLIVADSACAIRTRGLCHLESDLLFDSQDPRVIDLDVTKLSPGKVRVQFKDPTNEAVTTIEFKLVMVGRKWRIADIIYDGHPQESLKKMLSRPLPKG